MQFHVTELREFTEYTFYVSAFNANGEGALSEEITCMTLSDIPADPPQNISLEASSSTSIIGIYMTQQARKYKKNFGKKTREIK